MKKAILLIASVILTLAVINSCKKETKSSGDGKIPWEGVEGQVKEFTTFNKERLAFGTGKKQRTRKEKGKLTG